MQAKRCTVVSIDWRQGLQLGGYLGRDRSMERSGGADAAGSGCIRCVCTL